MKPRALWIGCFALGAYNALLFGIGGVLFAALSFLFALPLVIRGDRASALSGLLLGFGATWLALMTAQSNAGGRLDDPAPWLGLGIVPGAIGLLLALGRVVHCGRTHLRT